MDFSHQKNPKHLSVESVDNSITDYDLSPEEQNALVEEIEKELQKQSVELVCSWIVTKCKFEDFEEDPSVKDFDKAVSRQKNPSGLLQALVKPRPADRGRRPTKKPSVMSALQVAHSSGVVAEDKNATNVSDIGMETAAAPEVCKNNPDSLNLEISGTREKSSIFTAEEIDHFGHKCYEQVCDCDMKSVANCEFELGKSLVLPSEVDSASTGRTGVTCNAGLLVEPPVGENVPIEADEGNPWCQNRSLPKILPTMDSRGNLELVQRRLARLDRLGEEVNESVDELWGCFENYTKQKDGKCLPRAK